MLDANIGTDFERMFEPEISIFSPPQPRRGVHSVTPTWRKSSPSNGGSTPTRDITSAMNGVKTEEAAVAQPISVQQRSTRLSFLNMRKVADPQRDSTLVNGGVESPAVTSHGLRKSKDQQQRRASFFRSGENLPRSNTGDQSNHSDDRRPSQASVKDDQSSEGGGGGGGGLLTKKGSVRKRLSMLKLGKKSSRAGLMGSLDEE